MQIYLNGKIYKATKDISISKLLTKLKIKPSKVAIEINKLVIQKENYKKYKIKEKDKVEIVTFIGGG
ncbi:MAG: sulfur carrier protein ThiS [Pelagibacteraceae bacterium]|jgi:sulfur carrier protein